MGTEGHLLGITQMTEPAFVAGDWGTSRLRLHLCGASGELLDSCTGPGASQVRAPYPELLAALLEPWTRERGSLPVVLCGMVGSTIGWQLAPALPCPAGLRKIAAGALRVAAGPVHIVPGLACRNRLGAPDFMRGEETQILGAQRIRPELNQGRQLLCLPGTHSKWALLDAGAVREFITAPTGELYAALSQHTILVHETRPAPEPEFSAAHPAFRLGLAEFARCPDAGLLPRIFECRSRRLGGEFTATDPAPFLSGLLIAADVHGAMTALTVPAGSTVHVVGATPLTELYSLALGSRGCQSVPVSGEQAVREGLIAIHHLLSEPGAPHDV
jgi:2-dehydro-3-deoxygalactonokinase